MLPVQEAVKQSVKTFTELYPNDTFRDLRLEEVSITEDGRKWQVTLSYKNPDYGEESGPKYDPSKELLRMTGWTGPSPRHFKTVTLNSEDGSLLSVKNAA